MANQNGIEVSGHARRVRAEDFLEFQLILPMDCSNLKDLTDVASGSGSRALVKLFRKFDPEPSRDPDVPDPYYGGLAGFKHVFEIVDRTCGALVDHLRRDLGERTRGLRSMFELPRRAIRRREVKQCPRTR